MESSGWRFWIDRGGTFTDIVAISPEGDVVVRKVLSEAPGRHWDAGLAGIREILALAPGETIPADIVASVRMGTTVGTNALLTRTGEPTALLVTEGFGDALIIGYQDRPDIFALEIRRPEPLYCRVIEVPERISVDGRVVRPLDIEAVRTALEEVRREGIDSVAVTLLHGQHHPVHERAVAALARQMGFRQVVASHEVSPLTRFVARAETTLVDAYLTPLLRRYVRQVAAGFDGPVDLRFMQSSGGLATADAFRGRDSVLSGPVGGVIGAIAVARAAGLDRIVSFDMGGTSTDVAHHAGEIERTYGSEVGGVHLRVPMLRIHTVAAGGGSILRFDGSRFRVGPESAGARPGPMCYRLGGPLTLTDANLLLGRIRPETFPRVFGPDGDEPLDAEVVRDAFARLAVEVSAATGRDWTPEAVAGGFLDVAVQNMARAIKRTTVHRGYDVTDHALVCFGGAGGQHACRVADALGIRTVLVHPLAVVLSAVGIGLADLRAHRERSVEVPLEREVLEDLAGLIEGLETACLDDLPEAVRARARIERRLLLRYAGTDSSLPVDLGDVAGMRAAFEDAHRSLYGFVMEDRPVILDSVLVEAVVEDADARKALDGLPLAERATVAVGRPDDGTAPTWPSSVRMFVSGDVRDVALHRREKLAPGQVLEGPAIIAEAAGTNIIEPGWRACVTERGDLLLRRIGDGGPAGDRSDDGRPVNGTAGDLGPRAPRGVPGSDRSEPDPALLEVFHGLFMSIAEQMGEVLRNTAHSVNIKERLDFSCALFDGEGRLVANAPHIPVHLGSMGECVRALIADRGPLRRGEVWAVNSPFRGGTHLPDITVVTPVYLDTEYGQAGDVLLFHVASRGHHADVGGIAPGSMPPDSRTIEEEGVLTDGLRIVGEGRFLEDAVLSWLVSGPYPCRDPRQNLADLQAQAAANGRGVREIQRMVETHGLATVEAYMGHVRENAAEAVRRVIDRLRDGSAEVHMDGGSVIRVRIDVDAAERRVLVDLTGTSDQRDDNFNAPMAVTQAAVLYALRALVADEIPLNDGCLEPVDIVVPGGTLLNPRPPAAVAAGNVETSQHVVDAILAAAGAQAGSQGTMNNLTFGTVEWQYYETICGGTGAGPGFDGADAVHSHMTNTRITDPEVIERRFPLRVEEFSIRRGSGGDGRHRGGDGAVRRIRFLEGATVAILSSRRTIPPRGLAGGLAGAPGRNRLVRAGGAAEPLPGCARIRVAPGDVIVIETPGGGGYGPPTEGDSTSGE